MPRLRIAVALAAALVATMLAGAPAHAVTDRVSGHVKFVVINTNATSRTDGGQIAATGVIHAHGKDVVTGRLKDRFKFANGNLNIKHKPKRGSTTQSFDPATCLFKFKEKGTWKVGKGSTGAYADASGSGHYKVKGAGFACNPNKPPKDFYVRIKATGHLSY